MNATPITNNPATPSLSIIEKLDRFTTAWNTFAPEREFANMTLSEFVTGTRPSRDIRATLATRQSLVKGGISRRNSADKATQLLIRRVVGGVIADASYGPDCALYRAMGFTPTSERKTPATRAIPAEKAPRAPYVGLAQRYQKIVSAWEEFAPAASFAGMTLNAFKAAAAGSLSARAAIESSRTNCKGGISQRDAADAVTMNLMNRVACSVKAEKDFGNDCPLYRALGYVPASERRSAKRTQIAAAAGATGGAAA